MSAHKPKPMPFSKTSLPAGALPESQQLFYQIFQSSPTAMVLSRLSDGCFVEVNQNFLTLTGYSLAEVIGLTSNQAGVTSDPKASEERLAALKRNGHLPGFEVDVTRKSGEVRNGMATVAIISIGGEQFALSTILDITEHKRAEKQAAQMKRLYATLSQVNHTIVRCRSRDELFQSICDVTVQFGGFSLACIGLVDEASGDVKPVAANGLDVTHWPFDVVNLHRDETKNGLVATAIRTSMVVTSDNLQTDERVEVPRNQLQEFGYLSLAAVPFRLQGKTIGILNLVSNEAGLFKAKEEMDLLEEISLDISFALNTIEAEVERKKAEAARDQLARIVDTSDDAILSKTLDGVITSWNRGAERLYGYSPEEAIGASISLVIPSDQSSEMIDILEHIRRGEYIDHYETLRVCKDGKKIDVSITVSPIRDSAGNTVGASTIAHDITERKQAEEKLRESEERYRGLFEHMAEGYAYCQMIYENGQAQDWIYVVVNKTFEGLTGLKDVIGKRVSQVIPGIRESDPELFETYSRVALTRQPEKFETFVEALQMWFSISVYSPKKEFFVAVFDVITERKQAEQALSDSEKKYRLISENSADVIWTLNLATQRFTYVSPSVFNLRGLTPEEVMAQPMQAAITPASAEKIAQNLTARLAAFKAGDERARTNTTEIDQIHKDGSIVPTEVVTTLLTDSDGQVVEVLGVTRNITERKRAEEALRESERQMRSLVNSLDDIVFEFDEQGTYLNVWTGDESLLTHPKSELFGRTIIEILGEKNGRPFDDAVKRVLASGQSESIEYFLDVIGGQRWFLASISPVVIPGHPLRTVSMLIRNITERKQAEHKIRNQLEHLKSLREIDAVISSSFDMKLSLDVIVSRAISQLNVDAADVLVVESGSTVLECRAGHGFRTKSFQNYELQVGEGIAGGCVLERRPLHIRDLRLHADALIRKTFLTEEKFIGYYCIPLINKGEVKGALEIFHRSQLEFDQEWIDFLNTLAGQAAIAIESATLFEGLQRSNIELRLAYNETIEGWSRALDLRDKETEGHTQRVTELTVRLAQAFGFNNAELVHVRRGALLHDIGKLGVPDEILFKSGPLTDDEWAKMRKHPQFAYDMISPIGYLAPALDIPYCHHEKWDGTGYPRGLKGEQIPLAARLFAVVDVWDALCNDRPYRPGWPQERVLEHIRSLSGTHFDPKSVDLFFQVISKNPHKLK